MVIENTQYFLYSPHGAFVDFANTVHTYAHTSRHLVQNLPSNIATYQQSNNMTDFIAVKASIRETKDLQYRLVYSEGVNFETQPYI